VGLDDPRVTLLLGIGLPVDRFDFGPVRSSPKAKFVIHAERDELISIRDIRRFYAELGEPKELVVIDGADHLFNGKTAEVGEAVEDLLGDFGSADPKASKVAKAPKVAVASKDAEAPKNEGI